MDFPIVELMDRQACLQWLEEHFHPSGLKCPHCQAGLEQALLFRKTKRSDLDVYRCKICRGIYNLYSGTVFEGRRSEFDAGLIAQMQLFMFGISIYREINSPGYFARQEQWALVERFAVSLVVALLAVIVIQLGRMEAA